MHYELQLRVPISNNVPVIYGDADMCRPTKCRDAPGKVHAVAGLAGRRSASEQTM